MAQLPSAFNPNEHETMQEFSSLPSGDYIARITESEFKNCSETAKDPNGKYLKLTFTVEHPEKFKKRKLWVNLNLINKNQTAVDIANSELATITKSCGINHVISDSQELHGIPLKIKVALVPDGRSEDFPPKNEIKGYGPVDGATEVTETPQQKNSGKKKMPWE